MMENPDQNSDYALRAIQEPRLRETEEFSQWISVPENKELFLDLMACKEAVMRESLDRRRKVKTRMRIWVAASAVAAALVLAFLIPSLLPSLSVKKEQPVRFFAATASGEHVVLQMDGHNEQQLLEDSVMDIKEWKTLTPDTTCCQTLTTPRGKSFILCHFKAGFTLQFYPTFLSVECHRIAQATFSIYPHFSPVGQYQ